METCVYLQVNLHVFLNIKKIKSSAMSIECTSMCGELIVVSVSRAFFAL